MFLARTLKPKGRIDTAELCLLGESNENEIKSFAMHILATIVAAYFLTTPLNYII